MAPELQWTPGALTLLVSFAMWGLAGIVYRTRRDRRQNRYLVRLLIIGGIGLGLTYGMAHIFVQEDAARTVHTIGIIAYASYLWAYLRFLATIPSSVGRFLAKPWVQRLNDALLAIEIISFTTQPQHVIDTMQQYHHIPGWGWDAGPLIVVSFVYGFAAFLLGIAVAVTALRQAKGEVARRQARWYVAAFVGSDSIWLLWAAWWLLDSPGTVGIWHDLVAIAVIPMAYLWLSAVLAYGILRYQLFDIDLKVKAALRQSTIGALFAGAFVVISELLEQAVPAPGIVTALLVALLIAAGLRPVQSVAQRFADRLLPNVVATDEYLGTRRITVYQAAVEGALEDGTIAARERAVLDRLVNELDISVSEAEAVEARVQAAAG